MTDKPVRPQLNIRLHKYPELLDDIKQAASDRILRSFTTGRGRIAPSAPQYKSAVKVLDRFITEIQGDTKTPPGDST